MHSALWTRAREAEGHIMCMSVCAHVLPVRLTDCDVIHSEIICSAANFCCSC